MEKWALTWNTASGYVIHYNCWHVFESKHTKLLENISSLAEEKMVLIEQLITQSASGLHLVLKLYRFYRWGFLWGQRQNHSVTKYLLWQQFNSTWEEQLPNISFLNVSLEHNDNTFILWFIFQKAAVTCICSVRG